MNNIVKALEENLLYGNSYANVCINKTKDFFESYKINKGPKNNLPNSIKRNNDGFLLIDYEPYIISDLKTDGHNEAFWMLLSNGSRILLKDVDNVEIQNELLFKCLCKWLDIPCANNDVAIFEGDTYLLSPSFLGINEYLFNYYDVYGKLEIDINELIKKASLINQDFHLKKMLTVDILTQNQDRFPRNFKVIKSSKQMKICPLYDNGILEINNMKLFFKHYPSINGSIKDDDILNYLMQDDEYKKWCFKKIISRQMPNFRNQIYNDKGVYIDDNVYDSFNKTVNDGKALILDNFKNS